ncbi:NAD(P)/FAD-dependent oxidoreductase [Rhodoligotrophos appendicifer]|uniref:NAD(P)/FAD-dependent oxidoreductase n=1 Tax=Rhodoligotrophos appendicifer TaxID=987056 RepID=UPI001FE3977E|nr:FAD-binding oxidoreductase [Rhodoligotrophos appendicifer]
MESSIFTSDFREQPYWWDAAPLLPQSSLPALPALADVVIIGSGYTGLVAAVNLARAGADVVVIEAEDAGYGASRRNAGYLGRTLKRDYAWLAKRHGSEYAHGVYRELNEAYEAVRDIAVEEGIDCHINQCGRFIGATSRPHYEILAADLETNKRHLGVEFQMISRAEQHREIASDAYFGGAVIPDLGSIHPGLYHSGLLRAALNSGVKVISRTTARSIRQKRSGSSKEQVVDTDRGEITAGNVISATNGYTRQSFSWLAQRLVPFKGYMIATEVLSADLINRLLPHRRTYIETNMNINFIRPAPDSERILFGGLTGSRASDARAIAPALRRILQRLLPDIGEVRLSHAWLGQCAGTFDFMPHIGGADGHYYAGGYNFAGVPMGTHFGRKLALKILGKPEGQSVFEIQRFPTLPLYNGNAWFMPLAMKYFDLHDRWIARG